MSELKKKGNIRVKGNQIEMIVQAMEENPYLNENKFSSFYTALQRTEDWESLAQKLNTTGGAIKNVKAWQKCWSDKKSEVKKKNRILKAARLKTGGGQVLEKDLTPLEERILLLIGLDAAEGLNIEESEAAPSAFIPTHEECVNSVEDVFDVGDVPSQSTSQAAQPSPSTSQAAQPLTQIITTPLNPKNKKDLRVRPRIRTKPVVLRAEHSKQLVESEKEKASALTLCAEALQKQTTLKEEEIRILKENVELKKKELEIEQLKADAFVAIANVLHSKFSE